MKKRFLVLAMALCMVFALGFAYADTAEAPAEKTYDQAAHETVCVAEGFEKELCNNPEHTYDPTCTEKGAVCYLCPLCMKCLEKEEVPALGHNYVDREAKAPTCHEVGWEAYAYCSNDCCIEDDKPLVWFQKNDKGEYETIPGKPYVDPLYHKKDGELQKIPADPNWDPSQYACGEEVSLDAICALCKEVLTEKIDIKFDHEWEPVEKVDPTCTDAGVEAHEVCTREVKGAECGAVKFNGKVYDNLAAALAADKTMTIANLGHNLVAVNGTPGSCEESAKSDHMACDRKDCDYTEGLLELPAPGHEFTKFIPEVPATCTTKGLEAAWECTVCGQLAANVVEDDENVPGDKIDARAEIPALNHMKDGKEAWKTILGTPATCETNGVAAHRVCTLCGKIQYNGSEYAEKIGQELVVIPAHGHVDEDGFEPNKPNSPERKGDKTLLWTQADMIAAGKITLAKGEKAEKPDTAPTCDTMGYICTKYCPWCYEVREEASDIPVLGHIWELTKKGIMPGCTTTGISDEWTCQREGCGKKEGWEEIAALDHHLVPVEAKIPDCYEDGHVGFFYCDRYNKDENGELVKCDHGYVTADAGFGVPGYEHADENVAGKELTITFKMVKDELVVIIPEYVKIAKFNHGYAADVDTEAEYLASESEYATTVEAVAPTCTENGILGDGIWCELCESYVVVPTVDPALGHGWSKTVAAVDPTCLEAGHKAYQSCDRENCLAYREVDKDGKPVNDKIYTGTLDADKKEVLPAELVIAALGHKEIDGIATAPTCTEKGKTAGTFCERCGMAMKGQEEVPALGHDFKTTVIAKVDPTCVKEGTKEYHLCSRCKVGEYVEADGKTVEFTYTVDAKGNAVLDKDTKAALVIPALGHIFDGEESYVAKEEPTCFGNGHEEGLRCGRCVPEYADGKNDAWLIYPSVINCKGHPAATTIKVEGVAPLCEEEGYHDFFYCTTCNHAWFAADCDICDELDADDVVDITMVFPFPVTFESEEDGGDVIIPEIVKIDALGHDLASYVDRAPTCLDDGIMTDKDCQREGCDYKEPGELRPAVGHIWEVVAKVEPTCEKDGKVEGVKCTVCGQMAELTKAAEYDYSDPKGNYIHVTEETRTAIPALGHDMQHVDRKAATCTEDGHEDGKICANGCGKKEGAETIKATGHNIEGVKWTVIKQPTTGIDGEGIRVKYCKVCGEVGAQELIPATSEGQLGDANLDGNVDLFDVVRIMNYALDDTIEIGDKGDYNGDGEIDIFDAIGLMNYLLG